MEIDWTQVKKQTLWQYEQLIAKLLDVLQYSFVQECYQHEMAAAGVYANRLQRGYQQHGRRAEFIDEIKVHLETLYELGIQDYMDLLQKIASKDKCVQFLYETKFSFDALIQVLNFLFRWVLPFRIPVKELTDTIPSTEINHGKILKTKNIRSNLDVLENFRSKRGRMLFAGETGIIEEYVLNLAHRADISRLAYVRGKTIKHLCGGGYDSLDKLANAEIATITADMELFYQSIGKSLSDFQAVIPLDWMIGGARVLPRVIKTD